MALVAVKPSPSVGSYGSALAAASGRNEAFIKAVVRRMETGQSFSFSLSLRASTRHASRGALSRQSLNEGESPIDEDGPA